MSDADPATDPAAEPAAEAARPAGAAGRRSRLPLVVLVLLLVVMSGFAGAVISGPDNPGDTSVEAGFGRDMIVHHAQAVDMAMAVRDATGESAVRTLALDIALTQQNQIGRMQAWLIQWKLPLTSARPAMAWMKGRDHDGGHQAAPGVTAGAMPGMASATDLQRLREARGKKAEILFLTLMVRHHRGGVEMAEEALVRTDRAEVRGLALSIVNGQLSEINVMQQMLRERGAPNA